MTVCATMIARNEERILLRCLGSLVGIVDCAVIVDTGSTDTTRDMIRDFKDFPIHLHERPWVGFGHNRTEAINLARPHGEFLLRVDCDQTIAGTLPDLTADGYNVLLHHGTLRYRQVVLFKSSLPWKYVGAAHEYLGCDVPHKSIDCNTLIVTEHADSSRRTSGEKFRAGTLALEAEHRKDPTNTRTVFYLARNCEDMGRKDEAIHYYKLRTAMNGGYDDEVFYSYFRLGLLTDDLSQYFQAWQLCPHRWEPVYHACLLLRSKHQHEASYALSKRALATCNPDGLFVSSPVYEYLLLFEHSISSFHVGEYAESIAAGEELLTRETMPGNFRDAVKRNLTYPRDKIRGKMKVAV